MKAVSLALTVVLVAISQPTIAQSPNYRGFMQQYQNQINEVLDICTESGSNYFTVLEIEMAKSTGLNTALGNNPDMARVNQASNTHQRCVESSVALNKKYYDSLEDDGRCQRLIDAFHEYDQIFLSNVTQIVPQSGDTVQSWASRMSGFKAQIRVLAPRVIKASC